MTKTNTGNNEKDSNSEENTYKHTYALTHTQLTAKQLNPKDDRHTDQLSPSLQSEKI